jgi:deazaflavin-dependent oxidoreductase (nitroreductase family)
MASRVIRRILKVINRFFMVPLFRLGLGAFVGNPITGYIMVLKTMGRKTGKVRYAPVNYAIVNGDLYCMAGFGSGTHWYRNLQSQPKIEIITPSGSLAGLAEDFPDTEEAGRIMRQLLKNSGFAGFFVGFNPYSISDGKLRDRMKEYPLVRIRTAGVRSGAGDPGGWLWLLCVVVTVAVLLVVLI